MISFDRVSYTIDFQQISLINIYTIVLALRVIITLNSQLSILNFHLSTLNSQLLVECLFKGREFRLATHAAFPPRLNEAETVTH